MHFAVTLHNILLTIQCYTVIGLFAESWIVFRNWKSRPHGYLFLSCVASLACNIGYLLQMTAGSEEAYVAVLKFAYAGRVLVTFSLLLFVASLCRVRIPGIVKNALVLVNAAIYVAVLTFEKHDLFYIDPVFTSTGVFPVFTHGNGIVHHLFIVLQIVSIILAVAWLIIAQKREKDRNARDRLRMVLIAVLAESFFFLVKTVDPYCISEIYDLNSLGYFIGTMIMLVAIHSYNLLDTEDIAREVMIDRLSEGVIAVDPQGRVQYYNKTAKRMYPKLKTMKACVPAEIIRAASAGENIDVNGRIYSAEETPLFQNGADYGKLYALVDETEHIRYMKELEEQKAIADNANEAKSRFLANMSHEIRTPINAVLGMDEMILRETKEDPIRSYAVDIMSAGRTLLSLINDILDLSKVEEGRMEIVPVQYELSSLINDLSNMIRDRAARKGLRFGIEVDEKTPHLLCGDEVRIRQCALNILTNAVKYTEKGSVSLKISYEKKDEEHIMLGFAVEDTGIGMKEEDLDTLFSPYKRFEAERNRAIEGTGLGMSITKQLLDLMGSELHVVSEYGKGSTLSFEVEQEVVRWTEIGDYTQRFSEAKRDVHSYRELFHAPDARILVVDDTEMNITVMQSLLKRTGIRIDTALSGQDAITLAAGNLYDVIFIDHMMPEMDGIETLKHLREEGKNKDTPAIALTANAVSGARKTYLDAGFADYVPKPVDGEKLEKLLYVLLPDEKLMKPADDISASEDSILSAKSRVLVIDDDESVCALIGSIMEPLYDVKDCLLGADAVRTAKEYDPDLILLDIHLSDGNGFEIMQSLKKEPQTADIPVLMLTGDNDSVTEENGFKSGASDYIRKPFVPDVLLQRVKRIIALHNYQQSIEEEVERQTLKSRRLTREMMLALSKTVDTKDHYTDGHSRRVAAMSAELARRLGKPVSEQVMIYEIGLLHDIGKIGIHEDIIHKNSRLTDDEFTEIKEHTVKGYEILKEIADMPKLREGARWHHEHFDGTGYPDGLKGEQIPETARIVCVADCYDAMTSTRTYSEPRRQEDVRAEIARCSGTMFDPHVAEVMLNMIDEDTEYRMNEHAEGSDVWKEYDRFWGDLGALEEAEGEEKTEVLPEWLDGILDLDKEKGIKNCGSEEGYLSVLTVFHQTASVKADEIERLYEEDDISNYTVRVHALKSSARILGADKLSRLAEELEAAGKEGNRTLIEEKTGELLDMYRELDGRLFPQSSALSEMEDPLPAIGADAMEDAYRTVLEIAHGMDYGLMEDILKDLRGYTLEIRDRENTEAMERLLTGLDWDGIIQLAEKALKEREEDRT